MSQAPTGSTVRMKSMIALAGAALFAASAAQAESVQLNPNGTGFSAVNLTGTPMAAQGSGFVVVQPNPSDASSLTFMETGAYEMTQADGATPLAGHDVTLTYSLAGTLDPLSGQASFTGGIVNLYADAAYNFGATSANASVLFGANDGLRVASFSVTSGGGFAGGAVTLNASAIIGSILPGYFFSTSGADMAATQQLQLAVTIGNTVNVAPSASIVSEIVCKAASFPGPGCAGGSYANTPYYFVVSDHAQAVLSAVPEPTSAALGLAGIGLVAAAVRHGRARDARRGRAG